MSFLEIALSLAARGWHVHPLKPGGKIPITSHGKNDATTDAEQIRAWWAKTPDANVGISCGPSGLCVLDADHGLQSEADFVAWRGRNCLPVTYAVRSGRRPEFGIQMYYKGGLKDGKFELDGVTGEIKSLGGLVLAAGCVHPISKEMYHVLVDAPLAYVPAIVNESRKFQSAEGKREWNLPVHDGEGRDDFLIHRAGKLRSVGASEAIIRAQLDEWNNDPNVIADPKPTEDLDRIARSAARYDVPALEPTPVFGSSKKETFSDWRGIFHTKDEALNAPPVTFLIKDFLQREGVCGLAAPVRERKSLIALNVVHALLTGEKLFDHFEVVKKPDRVLYLCPEVSLGPFTDRVRKIGLLDYVGERFFYRTMSADGHLQLNDPTFCEALPGSVVILDTAIRFLSGDENSSADVRAFADSIFALLRNGAEAVLLLHHSPKGMNDTMTLENALRGSGDIGAFLASCWGTRLQDPDAPYESTSFLTNLKMRDFESESFEVSCSPDCRMRFVDNGLVVPSLAPRRAFKGNKDGRDAEAIAFLRANPKLSSRKAVEALGGLGIKRGATWVQDRRYEMMQEGARTPGG